MYYAFLLGASPRNFTKETVVLENQHSEFSHFDVMPLCDGLMVRETDRHWAIAYALHVHHTVIKCHHQHTVKCCTEI